MNPVFYFQSLLYLFSCSHDRARKSIAVRKEFFCDSCSCSRHHWHYPCVNSWTDCRRCCSEVRFAIVNHITMQERFTSCRKKKVIFVAKKSSSTASGAWAETSFTAASALDAVNQKEPGAKKCALFPQRKVLLR